MTSIASPTCSVILVVEDDALLRLTTLETLEEAGFEAIGAPNADQAIIILESRNDICTVFTDIEMPGSMDGLKLAAAVRNRWPPIKLIVTSGKQKPGSADMPIGSHFFPKPCDFDALLDALTAA